MPQKIKLIKLSGLIKFILKLILTLMNLVGFSVISRVYAQVVEFVVESSADHQLSQYTQSEK